MLDDIRLIFIGDVIGRAGRQKLESSILSFRKEYSPDLVVVNVENAAGGFGMTRKIYSDFLEIGVDIMTSGNHIFDNKDIVKDMNNAQKLLRPANYPTRTPGRGEILLTLKGDRKILIANIQGRVFMPCIDCPFQKMEELLKEYSEIDAILVDFHGEATAEKQAFGNYFDGRVSAIVGTHTHVATTDCRILPKGTGYITDVGMCGVRESIIGMEMKPSINRFLTMTKVRFGPAKGEAILQAVIMEIDAESGTCTAIKRIEIE